MPDLDEDNSDFREIPIEAVIKPVNDAGNMLEEAQKLLSRKVKEAFPKGTIIQREEKTYEVVGSGFVWLGPAKLRLKNTSGYATINIDVTEESEQQKIRILEHPEYE